MIFIKKSFFLNIKLVVNSFKFKKNNYKYRK